MSEGVSVGPALEPGAAELAQVVADIAEGRTDLAVAAGLSERDLEAIYAAAHGLYSSGRYREALEFFEVLCVCRQTDPRFWFGLGAASQLLGDASTALKAYGMAATFDMENPQISLRAAECLIKLGDTKTARLALEAVVELAEGKPDQAAYLERARLALEQIGRKGEPA